MKKTLLLITILSCSLTILSQSNYTLKKQILWDDSPIVHNPTGNFETLIYHFEGAIYKGQTPTLPYVFERFELPSNGKISYRIINLEFESFQKEESIDDLALADEIIITTTVEDDRRKHFGKISFAPIIKNGNSFERVINYEIEVTFSPQPFASSRGPNGEFESVLRNGTIYKIATTEDGIHKLSYDFLKTDLGINIDNMDPRTIKIYGNGGGVVAEDNSIERYDDLEELAIYIKGEDDGAFNSNDFILFYGEGPHSWSYNAARKEFNRNTNPYDDRNYYFIKIGDSDPGKRVSGQPSISSTEFTSESFLSPQRFEEEEFNLLFEANGAQGTGKDWFGDQFFTTREKSFDEFNFPGIISSETARLHVGMAGRHGSNTSFRVNVGNEEFVSTNISGVNLTNNERPYAAIGKVVKPFSPTEENINVTISYPPVGDGTNRAWLDFIEINVRRETGLYGDQTIFRDDETISFASSTFIIKNTNASSLVWDITNSENPKKQEVVSTGSQISFGLNTEELKTFVVFNENGAFPQPEIIGEIENQNLHSINDVDMLIVYHEDFESAANLLKEHRESHSSMKVALAEIQQVYNEFSSGSTDPGAIRDFAKLLYDRTNRFKYLLLFGDGTFDSRDIYEKGLNFIPVYETRTSLDPINGFPSDDFYALLSDEDGANLNTGALDIGVGRIPSKSIQEANAVVNKIIHYDKDIKTKRDWRNRVVFVADDEDGNAHLNQADNFAVNVKANHPVFNQDKIYFDAFQQISTSGGARFPKANESLNRNMFRGALVVNYMGHGGSRGWAQERVLTQEDIASWDNFDNLPLLITATCSFAGYDEPNLLSGGEQAILKADGGAIALYTTVRAVYSNQNFELTSAVFDTIFGGLVNDSYPPIGEILRVAKNSSGATVSNTRKFTLLGDPSMNLAIPIFKVKTTSIDGKDVSINQVDTLKALQKVTIEGIVTDNDDELMSNFNGEVYPTIFDKTIIAKTLGQDGGSEQKDFEIQKNLVFKGKATVVNGRFSYTFVIPKDIDYAFGNGKISYYAHNGVTDARGYYEGIIIGGANENAIEDNEGPVVDVYMDSEDFVSGGLTSSDPTLLIKLSDDNGINVVGSSVGHDLTAILDGNTQNPYILNDFYESEQDNFRKGSVRFPLFDLEEGLHHIKVTAWDVFNNFSDGFTEFVVAEDEEVALKHVLNYPNPFTTSTNFQFEHNRIGQSIDVNIQIFTISGKLVKTIIQNTQSEGNLVRDINWDGTDDFGDRLGKGVYVYKVKVRAPGLEESFIQSESDFERLVILK